MARINSKLLARLIKDLSLGERRVYELIGEKSRATHLPLNLAAIALAAEKGINTSKYASDDDLATIRQSVVSSVPRTVAIPERTASIAPSTRGKRTNSKPKKQESRRGTTVFVVYGRNAQAKDAMFSFLRSIGLKPLEWTQALRLTKQGSPYVGTILETAFREAAAVVVLLTPDDQARLQSSLIKQTDPEYESRLTGQARPNVLFEAGMAFGKSPESTVLVQIGEIRPFSDVAGRHVVHISNEPTSRSELITKLANAGCNVDTSGTDWLSAGNFRISAPSPAKRKKPRTK